MAPPEEASENSDQRRREERELARKRERLLRRAVPVLLVAPWFLGVIWTALHPLVSVITGELKCRGLYIDENGLDVHRHRVEAYPLERTASNAKNARRGSMMAEGDDEGGMCDAISSGRLPVSPSVECLRHEATGGIAFDVARILPSLGPVIESADAVVLVVGEDRKGRNDDTNKNNKRRGDWYERSDLNASILHLIKKLSNAKDCPWLTKAVFVVSPATVTMVGTNGTTSTDDERAPAPLRSIVDAFIASYMGDDGAVRALPPDFTFPMIRSVLVFSDVVETTATARTSATDVRILPQGAGGALPNLDLVFAAHSSLQSRPAGNGFEASRSVYYGNSEVRTHPFDGGVWEERVGRVVGPAGRALGLEESAVGGYAKDLAGLLGFVAGLAIGPPQPHASALRHGIDALTIELRIPPSSSASIHPHYADFVRCTEHLLRSISNLHERLHHSIAQYIMPSPSKFVSHGEYVYPAVLVSLPMVVRAASLALRDLTRFRFAYAAAVLETVCAAASVLGAWAVFYGSERRKREGGCCSEWMSYAAFALSYLLVVTVARRDRYTQRKGGPDATEQTKQQQTDESRKSLRFIACLVGVYLHAPLLLANYSLGFPSSAFWSPLLATLVPPPSLRDAVARSGALSAVALAAKLAFLGATCPPVLLVPRIFPTYTLYVLLVYAPLHLLLAALWLA